MLGGTLSHGTGPCGGRLSRWVRAGVAACIALVSAPALAQPTAEEVADRAVASIEQTTRATTARLEAGTTRAVAGVKQLDLLGAPDRRIISFGQSAIEALNRVGLAGRGRIESTTRHAVHVLRRLQAPQALIDEVTEAARMGLATINQSRQRGVQAVRDAVEEAIGPG